jgi:hypothetical protein
MASPTLGDPHAEMTDNMATALKYAFIIAISAVIPYDGPMLRVFYF